MNRTSLTAMVAVVAATVAALPASAETQCRFSSRNVCSPSGCVPGNDASGTYVVLRPETGQYGRCGGSKPCDWYPMMVHQSGTYLNITFASGVQGAKMAQDGSMFVETVSIRDTVIVGYGQCQ